MQWCILAHCTSDHHSLFICFEIGRGRIQITQNLVAIIDSRQILGIVSIYIQSINIYAELDEEIDAVQMPLSSCQVERGVAKLITLVRIATARAPRKEVGNKTKKLD